MIITIIIIIIIIYEGQESALEPLERLHVTRLHLMIECWGALLWDHSMPRRSRRRVTTCKSLGPFYAETIVATGYNLHEFPFLCRDDRGGGLQPA